VQATKEILNFSRDHSVKDGEFSPSCPSLLALWDSGFLSRTCGQLVLISILGLNYVAAYNMSMVLSDDVKDSMLSGLSKSKSKPTFAKL
jgi:hypothetical protein